MTGLFVLVLAGIGVYETVTNGVTALGMAALAVAGGLIAAVDEGRVRR